MTAHRNHVPTYDLTPSEFARFFASQEALATELREAQQRAEQWPMSVELRLGDIEKRIAGLEAALGIAS